LENKHKDIEKYLIEDWIKFDTDLIIESIKNYESGKKIIYSYQGIRFGCYINQKYLSFFFFNEFCDSDITFWKSKYQFRLIVKGLDKTVFNSNNKNKLEVIIERSIPTFKILSHDCKFILIMLRCWSQGPNIDQMEVELYDKIIKQN
jgi:hypothetical protein